jgi:chromosome segregation ATPase
MAKTDTKLPANFAGQTTEQSIEQLQQRYHELNDRKIRAEAQRDNATTRLNELKAQAQEKYGTDDVARLQEQLAGIITENAQKKARYQADLDNIEKGLAAVEAKFSDTGSGQGQ